MRNHPLILAAVALALAVSGLPGIAGTQNNDGDHTQTVALKVPDMSCGGCEVAVKMAANRVSGVKGVKTNAAKRTAEVTYDPSKTDANAIANAITKSAGFRVEVPKAAQK